MFSAYEYTARNSVPEPVVFRIGKYPASVFVGDGPTAVPSFKPPQYWTFRLGTTVVDAILNGAVPVATLEVITPEKFPRTEYTLDQRNALAPEVMALFVIGASSVALI